MLPKQYQWLEKEKAPRVLLEALKFYGLKETKGAKHNPVILGWAKELGGPIASFYKADEVPWCGLFMAICVKRAGFAPPPGYDALRALKWARWGMPTNQPMLGDILSFNRPGGGHVGLYVGEDDECFHVLGGNQGDSVSITRIACSRLFAARRAEWKIKQPKAVRSIVLAEAGEISKNEA